MYFQCSDTVPDGSAEHLAQPVEKQDFSNCKPMKRQIEFIEAMESKRNGDLVKQVEKQNEEIKQLRKLLQQCKSNLLTK